ncbi:MAG: hypothetical protein IJV01_00065 [Bacteroidales bacterium]|nr:hypothetical protein [Bacteroidales bacterium]
MAHRFLSFIAFALLCAPVLEAQEHKYRNQVEVSYGLESPMNTMLGLFTMLNLSDNCHDKNYGLAYYREWTERVYAGGVLNYSSGFSERRNGSDYFAIWSIMASAKVRWFKYYGLSVCTRAGIGPGIITIESSSSSGKTFLRPIYHLGFLSLNYDYRHVGCFVELGWGYLGMLNGGFAIRF